MGKVLLQDDLSCGVVVMIVMMMMMAMMTTDDEDENKTQNSLNKNLVC
jgi:uncharacterized membrane protein YhhN